MKKKSNPSRRKKEKYLKILEKFQYFFKDSKFFSLEVTEHSKILEISWKELTWQMTGKFDSQTT